MKFGPIPVNEAEGKILAHNIMQGSGRRAFRKGKTITAEDVTVLMASSCQMVYVAELEPGDLDENSAARRIALSMMLGAETNALRVSGPSQGRASLVAQAGGVYHVDAARLERINACEGISFATLQNRSIVSAGQVVAAIKIIPYAISSAVLDQALSIAGEGGTALMEVRRFALKRVGVIYSGSPGARERVIKSFDPPLRRRIESCEAQLTTSEYVPLGGEKDEDALADLLRKQVAQGVEMIVLAGETSTMDRNDIIPRAVSCAGGQVITVGAPVEPGNLVMLAYLGPVPLLGVPGCIRNTKPTRVNQILAALLTGERLLRADIAGFGHGGLLEGLSHES